jgi:hypothetical protein
MVNSITGGLKMTSEEGIYKHGAGDISVPRPDILGIVFRCYERHASVEETLNELRRAGANDANAQMVERYFRELHAILKIYPKV